MIFDLNGLWKLSGGEYKCNCNIPGDFYSCLVEEKLLPDPYYGTNEQIFQNLNRTNWTIERSFDFSKNDSDKTVKHFLEINEIDTVFTVYLNNNECGHGNNQFIRYRFDITDFLKNGKNDIRIEFKSAELEAEEINKNLPYPVPYNKADVYSPNRNLVRKCQCNSGWDWGPALMVSGIYKNIFIESVSLGLFESLTMEYEKIETDENKNSNKWIVHCQIEFNSLIEAKKDFRFQIKDEKSSDSKCSLTEIVLPVSLHEGLNKIHAELILDNPNLWKTSGELMEEGLKENPLYEISVSYDDDIYGEKIISQKFAVSSLKCRSPKEADGGRALYFENNGRKFFAKGANWIPCDALPSRQTLGVYKDRLQSAVDANMNCIRVWGGGIYEKDEFYELCDRLGLIVWQDFMFACSLYPASKDFLDNVEAEITYQVKRLKSHPCIGIWCGNNENFGTLTWFPESRANRDRYLVDYDRLYNGLIGKIVQKLDPERLWWPSSPCAGPDDFADNWHQDNMGDMHFWSVWHERKNFDEYLTIRPRFVSEFGYQSFTSVETIKTYCPEDQLNFTSPVNDYHQRSPAGNALMLENFARYFRFPSGFENMVYVSQIQQAEAIRTAIEYWRSLTPYCMGSIVWQLNDVWPGPSWSSIEYGGKWKLLHYTEKRAYEPVHLSIYEKDGELQVWLINDYGTDLKNASVSVKFMDFDGAVLLENTVSEDSIKDFGKAGTSVKIWSAAKESITKELNKEIFEYFVHTKVSFTDGHGENCETSSTLFMDKYKHCDLRKPEISWEVLKTDAGTKIKLKAEKPAFFVYLDAHTPGVRFSDNGFAMVPGEERIIEVITSVNGEKSTEAKLDELTVNSLRDSY